MRKLLNTLYVTSPDAHLTREGLNVLVRVEEEIKLRIPIHNLEGIVTMGYTGASPGLLHLCADSGVSVSFHSTTGRLIARLESGTRSNVFLRVKQYQMHSSSSDTLALSRWMVLGKIANARSVLRRFVRDHSLDGTTSPFINASDTLRRILDEVPSVSSLDRLRGKEGEAARTYYGVFDSLILEKKDEFRFHGRSRRPPLDRVNAVLSFLYSLLAHDCASALSTVGLDPQVGFFHRLRSGRDSLALHIMEELRPYLVDRTALTLINNRRLGKRDFVVKETGAVFLNDEARKTVIDAWQTRKKQALRHPFLDETVEIGLIPYVQSLLLARFIRGDIDGYPPFLMK